MSRLAVKAFVAQQLALLDIPVPLTVLTQRPKEVEVGIHAVVVIELPETKEMRLTLGRPNGSKKVEHRVSLGIYWMGVDPTTGDRFDELLDQMDDILRTTTIPVTLTDPQSGSKSQLVWIGEEIETRVHEPLLDESLEGLIVYSAEKTYAVWEQVTG